MSTVTTDWRYRWVLVGTGGKRLHRAFTPTTHADVPSGWWQGYAVCGIGGTLYVPSFASRIDLQRCRWCCNKLGLPVGVGVPHNDETLTAEEREA